MKEEMTTTASAGIPQDTKNMGPNYGINVTDRRYSKKKPPVILRRFREYLRNDNAQSKAEKK